MLVLGAMVGPGGIGFLAVDADDLPQPKWLWDTAAIVLGVAMIVLGIRVQSGAKPGPHPDLTQGCGDANRR